MANLPPLVVLLARRRCQVTPLGHGLWRFVPVTQCGQPDRRYGGGWTGPWDWRAVPVPPPTAQEPQ